MLIHLTNKKFDTIMYKGNQWFKDKNETLANRLNNYSDLNISWSSSDSEDVYRPPKKKIKSRLIGNKDSVIHSSLDSKIIGSDHKFIISSKLNFNNSTTIESLVSNKLSPGEEVTAAVDLSPVIGCKTYYKKTDNEKKITSLDDDTPSPRCSDISIESDCSNSSIIIGKDPLYYNSKQLTNAQLDYNERIDDDFSSSMQTASCNHLSIEPFCSQESPAWSNKTCVTNATSNDMLQNTPNNLIDLNVNSALSDQGSYETNTGSTQALSEKLSFDHLDQQLCSKKRKRYKKHGLAYHLQKALQKHRIDSAIWRHEIYLQKSKSNISVNEDMILCFKIIKSWEEFNVTIVECEHIGESKNFTEMSTFGNSSFQSLLSQSSHSPNNCLILIGFNITHNLHIKPKSRLKLCMPYKTKLVKYDDKPTTCYFNVSRILSYK